MPILPRTPRALSLLPVLAVVALSACEDTEVPRVWRTVFAEQPGAFFSVHGKSASDIWLAGAMHPGTPAAGPTVLHYDGKSWQKPVIAAPGVDLWWAHATQNSVWFAGSKGTIVRHQRAAASWQVQQAPSTDHLFGIFAFSDQDVWAVGGPADCKKGAPCGVIWHFDGAAWGPAPLLAAELRGKATWFKVWGRNPSNMFVVGSEGHLLHFDGKTWTERPSGTTRTLFTVHGNQHLVVAVGGFGTGTLVEDTGKGFVDVTPKNLPQMNGVYVPEVGVPVAVGLNGEIWQRTAAGWQRDTSASDEWRDHHAVFVDPAGDTWAVGGQVFVPPFTEGQLVHRSAKAVAGKLP